MGFAILQLDQKPQEVSSWPDESFDFCEWSANENIYCEELEGTVEQRLKEGVY